MPDQRFATLHHLILKLRGTKPQIHWLSCLFVVSISYVSLPDAIGFNFIPICVNFF